MAEIDQRVLMRLQGPQALIPADVPDDVTTPGLVDPRVSQALQVPEESILTPVGRIFTATGDAVSDFFEAPFGQSPEERQELVDIGLLGTAEQQAQNPVLAFNDTLIGGTVAGVDAAFRVVAAPFIAGLAAINQAGTELGLSTVQNKAVSGLVESIGLQLMATGGGGLGTRPRGRRGRKRKKDEAPPVEKTRAKAGTLEEGNFGVNIQREGMNVTITQREGRPFTTLAEAEAFARVVEQDASADVALSLAVKQKIGEALVDVPEAQREAIRARLGQSFDEAQVKLKDELGLENTGLPEQIKEPVARKVVEAAEAALIEGRVKRNPDQQLSDQIVQMMQDGRLIADDVTNILKDHNITVEQFATLFGVKKSDAGRTMQALSATSQRLKKLGILSEELDESRKLAGFDAFGRMGNVSRRVANVYRAALVSALATATRNAISQGGRVSLAVIERGLEKATERMFLPANARSGEPIQAFGEVVRLFRRAKTKKETDFLLKAFPTQVNDLFLSFSSDVVAMPEVRPGRAMSKGEKTLRGAEKAVMIANVFNRFQEFAFRKAILASVMDRRLRARGTTLESVIKRNDIEAITLEDLRVGISDAFEQSFAKKFSPAAKGFEGVAGKFVSFMNSIPPSAAAIPFPRFMMQALEFQFEFSPLGFVNTLKLISPKQRAAISRGDVKAFNKALIGSTMYLMAWQLRNSEFAGERWHEIKIPVEMAQELGIDVPEGGSAVVTLLPFSPFITPLFVADIVKRKKEGTLNELEPKDVAVAVLGMGGRGGSGLAVADAVIDSFAGVSEKKDVRVLQEFLGQIASGFLQPINQLSDFAAAFDENEQIMRRAEGFTEQIQKRLPIVSQELPPLESPTRAAPPRRQAPLLRPFLGMSVKDKNRIERELDRLDFRYREIANFTGNPTADVALNAELGPIIEQQLGAFIQTEEYRLLPNDSVRAVVLKEKLKKARELSRQIATQKNPELFLILKGEQLPGRQRRAVESLTGQTPAEIIEESVERIR